MRRFILVAVVVGFGAASASAQTKVSGTMQCPKAETQQFVPVGDRPEHSLGVEQYKCTWSKPLEIEGAKSKDDVITETNEISGGSVHSHGFSVDTTEGGDKYFTRFQGTATMKDGTLESSKGTWTFNGGTGKLKGIKGKGTYTCAPSGDGFTCDAEGEYQLAK